MLKKPLKEFQGNEYLERYFSVDFRTIARDTCFLMSSVATAKKHKLTPHVYTSNKLADRRVGWIYDQAYTLALSSKYLESLARFDEVLRLEPGYIHAWNQKGLCNYFLKRYNSAISCFDKASSLNSLYLESLNNKGCALQRLDEFGAAIDCFDKVESIRAGLFETLNNKALSLIALGDYTGALTCVDRCISSGLVKGSFYIVRSICFLALDQIGEGLYDLTIASKLDPQSKHALALREVFSRAASA
ncbi:MAG: tetratricopeptide repeat protein [Halobacteriota archaeon]